MKKEYLNPDMLVVNIETTGMLAQSPFGMDDDHPVSGGNSLAPGYEEDFDDEEDEGNSWGYKKY
jgi:hypothetical protein